MRAPGLSKARQWWYNFRWFKENSRAMIDEEGYRANVGIVLTNHAGKVFWARRTWRDGWQFPQGGVDEGESPLEAMYRELQEETGLRPEHVQVLGCTPDWLRYRLPSKHVRKANRPYCVGQKQIWFLLRLTGSERYMDLACNEKPEFDCWSWVDYWYPLDHVVPFKREVYQQALMMLSAFLPFESVHFACPETLRQAHARLLQQMRGQEAISAVGLKLPES